MVFFKSSFSLLLGILSCPATYALYPHLDENPTDEVLRQYLDQVDVASLAVPSLEPSEGRLRLGDLGLFRSRSYLNRSVGVLDPSFPTSTAVYERQERTRQNDALPIRLVTGANRTPGCIQQHNPTDGETLTCAVCLQDVEKGEMTSRLPCSHAYHPHCINAWMANHNTCPICRRCYAVA